MQHKLLARLSLCVLLCLAAVASTAAPNPQLYASCVTCHGARGEGNAAVGAPAIAGQSESYLRRQLQYFRAGVRGTHKADVFGAQMRAANVATLRDDKALAALAQHVGSLPKTTVKTVAKFDARNGNNLYQGKCGACHGGVAEGNEALSAPRLSGLDAVYLRRQLTNFRTGVRGAHERDKYGRQMALMAGMVTTGKDVNDVIGHIQTVGTAR
jgi:cytochrome c553